MPGSSECVAVIREVILLLRNLRMEDFEITVERGVIVLVLFHHGARGNHNFLRPLGVAGLRGPQRRHFHVRPHVHVMAFHRMHGARFVFLRTLA